MFGKKVGLIENKDIGGTCVNVGCVPKKIMFNAANFLDDSHLFADYGITGLENVKLDFLTFKKNRDAYIKRLNSIYHKNVDNSGIDYIQGYAKFTGPKEIEVTAKEGSTAKYSADHVMIASGSKSILPTKFEGIEHCISSDDIFEMEQLPKSIVIIGGGYIGTEMAGIMTSFGVKTTLLVRDLLLARVDQEIVDLLLENMKKHKTDVRLMCQASKVTKDGNILTVHLTNGETI